MQDLHNYAKSLLIPTFISTEQAIEYGSRLNAAEHAILLERQRALSESAFTECDLQRKVNLATQSQLIREAAGAFGRKT